MNAAGTKTRIDGTRIRPEALDAMNRAAEEFVRLSDLQAAASQRIATATGAEAGYVISGAANALALGAAACVVDDDLRAIARPLDTGDRPMKVDKEELVGLLAALDAFLNEDRRPPAGVGSDSPRRTTTCIRSVMESRR